MSSPAPYEPDAWDVFCRRQIEGAMLNLDDIRSAAAKKAAAEDSSEYYNLLKAADAKAKITMQVRAALSKQMYEEECNATRNWIAAQNARETVAPSGSLNSVSEGAGGGPLSGGDQKVVSLKRQARINSVRQPEYCSLTWPDAITENMERVDRIARALEDENGGKRSKRHEKLLLQKYFEALGRPQTGSIGRSGYPEHIEKRVNRYLWLEHAFESRKDYLSEGLPSALQRGRTADAPKQTAHRRRAEGRHPAVNQLAAEIRQTQLETPPAQLIASGDICSVLFMSFFVP